MYGYLCHRSCPADGIRTRLQPRELTVHVVIHQDVALVGFLQHGVNDDPPVDGLQFHNGHTHHERDVSGACNRQDRLGIHASHIRDDRPGCGDRDVNGGIGIEERIAVIVDDKVQCGLSCMNQDQYSQFPSEIDFAPTR